jgi:type I restriction enzyme R subunit
MTENELERLGLNWFADNGWQTAEGPDIAPDGDRPLRASYSEVILEQPLRDAIKRINPSLLDTEIEEAIHKLRTIDHPVPAHRNRRFQQMLMDGIPVEVERDGKKEMEPVRIIDFNNVPQNSFLAATQFTIQGTKQPRRPDVVAFINGIPIAVIELKNPDNEDTDVWGAFNQIETYKDQISDLFDYNIANIISDGYTARLGSLTANTE